MRTDIYSETVKCNTVGELLQELQLAVGPHNPGLEDSPIYSESGEVFVGFRTVLRTLSDTSTVMDLLLRS